MPLLRQLNSRHHKAHNLLGVLPLLHTCIIHWCVCVCLFVFVCCTRTVQESAISDANSATNAFRNKWNDSVYDLRYRSTYAFDCNKWWFADGTQSELTSNSTRFFNRKKIDIFIRFLANIWFAISLPPKDKAKAKAMDCITWAIIIVICNYMMKR